MLTAIMCCPIMAHKITPRAHSVPISFLIKHMETINFQPVLYDTLLVTIGSGRGSNWWCLAFPPLCFANEAFIDVPDSSGQTLFDLLGPDLFDEICQKEKPKLTLGLFF